MYSHYDPSPSRATAISDASQKEFHLSQARSEIQAATRVLLNHQYDYDRHSPRFVYNKDERESRVRVKSNNLPNKSSTTIQHPHTFSSVFPATTTSGSSRHQQRKFPFSSVQQETKNKKMEEAFVKQSKPSLSDAIRKHQQDTEIARDRGVGNTNQFENFPSDNTFQTSKTKNNRALLSSSVTKTGLELTVPSKNYGNDEELMALTTEEEFSSYVDDEGNQVDMDDLDDEAFVRDKKKFEYQKRKTIPALTSSEIKVLFQESDYIYPKVLAMSELVDEDRKMQSKQNMNSHRNNNNIPMPKRITLKRRKYSMANLNLLRENQQQQQQTEWENKEKREKIAKNNVEAKLIQNKSANSSLTKPPIASKNRRASFASSSNSSAAFLFGKNSEQSHGTEPNVEENSSPSSKMKDRVKKAVRIIKILQGWKVDDSGKDKEAAEVEEEQEEETEEEEEQNEVENSCSPSRRGSSLIDLPHERDNFVQEQQPQVKAWNPTSRLRPLPLPAFSLFGDSKNSSSPVKIAVVPQRRKSPPQQDSSMKGVGIIPLTTIESSNKKRIEGQETASNNIAVEMQKRQIPATSTRGADAKTTIQDQSISSSVSESKRTSLFKPLPVPPTSLAERLKDLDPKSNIARDQRGKVNENDASGEEEDEETNPDEAEEFADSNENSASRTNQPKRVRFFDENNDDDDDDDDEMNREVDEKSTNQKYDDENFEE